MTYWKVAVEAPIRSALTYAESADSLPLVKGSRVVVPLGKRSATGVLLDVDDHKTQNATYEIKAIKELFTENFVLNSEYLKWAQWISEYYSYPIGLVLSGFFPPLKKSKKLNTAGSKIFKNFSMSQVKPDLTDEQKNVVQEISQSSGFAAHLLFGVTGAGKTEVYLRLIESVLSQGKQVLVLVPEISLTPQLVQRFYSRFGDQIAVIHSQLTPREKTDFWWDVAEGNKKILIGARSALFCPLPNLGMIIVDEEHEPSYKQEEKLKYHARDCAVMLARTLGIKIVLGSATPSLETWQNCVLGKYKVSYMRHRVNQIPLPEMVLINMKDQNNLDKNLPTWLSAPLFEAIHQTLENKMQVALFLNRRGSAHFVLCRSCGYTEECPNCDISLSFHRKTELLCHYCAYSKKFSLECSSCREGELAPVGAGTESIETDLTELFPDIKVARADRDEIQSRADLEDLIEKMETGETQILIGTQMIAKGLDFPKLNLVGIILADVGFHLPDFRATERSFQLIQQMSGRAGRSAGQGNSSKVMIQTYNPDHPALQFALKKDFEAFAAEEIKQREFLNYPPVGRLIGIRLQGTQLDQVQKAARLLSGRFEKVKSRFSDRLSDIECLGPVEAPIAKLRGNFRYQALVKGLSAQKIHQFVNYILEDEAWVPSTVRIIVDVDPIYLL